MNTRYYGIYIDVDNGRYFLTTSDGAQKYIGLSGVSDADIERFRMEVTDFSYHEIH
jgi:hypothetical protein